MSSIIIPEASTIWLRNSSDPIGCHGRTASYLTAPAQIPACGTTALGSSEILASVKDKLILPSLLFPAVRFAFVPPVLLARQMFPLQATYSVSPFLYFIECRVGRGRLSPSSVRSINRYIRFSRIPLSDMVSFRYSFKTQIWYKC